MLFLWSRESSTAPNSPRAGPWFAWFATAVLLWRCRRRIAQALAGAGSVLHLGLLRRRRSLPHRSVSLLGTKVHHHKHRHRHRRLDQHHQRHSPPSSALVVAEPPDNCRRRHLSCHQLHSVCQSQQHIGDRPMRVQQQQPQQQQHQQSQPRLKTKKRPKRVQSTEAPRRIAASASCVQISQQLYCRVTRSGRVYGRYPKKPPPIK